MTPKQKRLLTPLSAPRWPRAPWPLNVIPAADDGYYEAFFSDLIPPGYGGNHTKPIAVADRRIRRGLRGCGDDRHSEEESGAAGDCGPGSA